MTGPPQFVSLSQAAQPDPEPEPEEPEPEPEEPEPEPCKLMEAKRSRMQDVETIRHGGTPISGWQESALKDLDEATSGLPVKGIRAHALARPPRPPATPRRRRHLFCAQTALPHFWR